MVPAPVTVVWGIVSDYARYAEWFPDQKASAVLSTNGPVWHISGTVHLPFPLADRNFELTQTHTDPVVDGEQHHAQSWSYIPGSGNIVSSTGFAYVMPWQGNPQRSLVRMVVVADFGVHVPDFVLNWGARRMMRRVAAALNARAHTGR